MSHERTAYLVDELYDLPAEGFASSGPTLASRSAGENVLVQRPGRFGLVRLARARFKQTNQGIGLEPDAMNKCQRIYLVCWAPTAFSCPESTTSVKYYLLSAMPVPADTTATIPTAMLWPSR